MPLGCFSNFHDLETPFHAPLLSSEVCWENPGENKCKKYLGRDLYIMSMYFDNRKVYFIEKRKRKKNLAIL